MRAWFDNIRKGNLGALPAVLGLVVLCVGFSLARPVFFTERNFANLFTQGASTTVIAMGLIFVLLLGEIDLSAGFASGVCAAIMAVALEKQHMTWWVSILLAMVTGILIGLLLGWLVAKGGIPSFVVTLAAFLAFQGVALLLVKDGENISIHNDIIIALGNDNVPPWLGWLMALVGVGTYGAIQIIGAMRRRKRGITAAPWSVIALRVGGLAVLVGLVTFVLNSDRGPNSFVSVKGVPIVVPIVAVLLIIGTFVLHRTGYGRHLYAVGGNREAARRAGISVDAIRISAFVVCSFMASIGGILAASRAYSVDPNTGGSNVLLYAVGAAVIGGTSLFGGKGRIVDAVLGGLVMAVIDNGMGLMGYSSGVKYVFTGAVLLAAAGVDALSRRRAAAAS